MQRVRRQHRPQQAGRRGGRPGLNRPAAPRHTGRDDAAVPPAASAPPEPAPLLLLTGSPGTGKSTVAPLVADRHEPSACLDLDWFFAKLRRGAIEPWREEAHAQNRTVLGAAARACTTFAA